MKKRITSTINTSTAWCVDHARRKSHGALAGIALVLLALASPIHAQNYPSKPVSIVVPFGPGSGTDQVARAFSQALSDELSGTPVVIDNKPGANGFLAAQAVARAPADGHTLLLTTNTTQAANQHLFKKLPYDPVADFAPITLLSKGAMLLIVPAGSPIQSVSGLIALAKKQPGKLAFASGSSSSRIAGELFLQMSGTQSLHVPYKSNPLAMTDLMGERVQFMFADILSALPLVQSGKLRALGYTDSQRFAGLPDLPTIAEAGVKNYEMGYWLAVYAPHGTRPEVVKRLNDAFVKVAQTESVKKFLARSHMTVATSSPEGLAKFQQAEADKWGRIIKTAGIEQE